MSASTDPIADFLTRIRNAIQAAHETVDIPSSKLKVECARILSEQGYIDGYSTEAPNADHPGEILRVRLKYTNDRRSAISGLKRVSRPGRRTYAGLEGDPQGARRHGHRNRLHVARRHDRPRGSQRGRRRRSRGAHLVS